MARSRNIKPTFFDNTTLAKLPPLARLLFIGLWGLCDREGRLEDDPLRIKARILPYDKGDVNAFLDALGSGTDPFIVRYEAEGRKYIQVCKWHKHQNPHYKELPSQIPPPPNVQNRYNCEPVGVAQRRRIFERDGFKCKLCGSRDNLTIDHILEHGDGGDSTDENLRTLCGKCNLMRPSRKHRAMIAQALSDGQSNKSVLIPDSLNLIPDSSPPEPGVSPFWLEAGFEGPEQFEAWWELVVQGHPNRNRNTFAKNLLWPMIQSGQFSREEFEVGYARMRDAAGDDWTKQGGRFAQNLYEIIENRLWKYKPVESEDDGFSPAMRAAIAMED